MSDLNDLNPVPDEDGDRWAGSAAGDQARERMLDRAAVEVTAVQLSSPPPSTAGVLVAALLMVVVAATLVFAGPGDGRQVAGDACPVTIPDTPYFIPPAGFPEVAPDLYESAWYGSADLFTMVPFAGREFSPTGDKLLYWSRHFSSGADDYYQPGLTVTATRIDGTGDPVTVVATQANNGSRGDIGTFMITGMILPDAGCWRLTAEYRGTELSYVVTVPEA